MHLNSPAGQLARWTLSLTVWKTSSRKYDFLPSEEKKQNKTPFQLMCNIGHRLYRPTLLHCGLSQRELKLMTEVQIPLTRSL